MSPLTGTPPTSVPCPPIPPYPLSPPQDVQPRVLNATSAAVCASRPFLLLAVNLTEAAALRGAELPGAAWRVAGPHVRAGGERVRQAVARGSGQAWERVSPELQQKLIFCQQSRQIRAQCESA